MGRNGNIVNGKILRLEGKPGRRDSTKTGSTKTRSGGFMDSGVAGMASEPENFCLKIVLVGCRSAIL